MTDSKFMKAAKNWDVIAKSCDVLFRVVGIVLLVFAALVMIFGNKMYEPGSFTLDLDFIKLYLPEEYQSANGWIQAFTIIALLAVGAVCFAASYGIRQLRGILAPMKEGRPFEENMPRRLRNIAWTILAGGEGLQLVAVAERVILTKAYPLEQIFTPYKIAYSFTMDFSCVFIFCVVMFLSYIFDYGQKLQKESDETL